MSEQFQPMTGEFRVIVNGKNIAPLILERLRQKRALDVLAATKRLALAAKEGAEGIFFRRVQNGGYVDFRMDPVLYHAFGQKWGYEALRDKDFVADCVKKGSAIRVKNRNANPTVGYERAPGILPGSRPMPTRLEAGDTLGSTARTHARYSKTFENSTRNQ